MSGTEGDEDEAAGTDAAGDAEGEEEPDASGVVETGVIDGDG